MITLINSFSAGTEELPREEGGSKVLEVFSAQIENTTRGNGKAIIIDQFSVAPSGYDIAGVVTQEYKPAVNEILRYHGNG